MIDIANIKDWDTIENIEITQNKDSFRGYSDCYVFDLKENPEIRLIYFNKGTSMYNKLNLRFFRKKILSESGNERYVIDINTHLIIKKAIVSGVFNKRLDIQYPKFEYSKEFLMNNPDIIITADKDFFKYMRIPEDVLEVAISKRVAEVEKYTLQGNIKSVTEFKWKYLRYLKLSEEFIIKYLDNLPLEYLMTSHLKPKFRRKLKFLGKIKS